MVVVVMGGGGRGRDGGEVVGREREARAGLKRCQLIYIPVKLNSHYHATMFL